MNFNDNKPIFEQVADLIENQILDGDLKANDQTPSTNDFAKTFQINPATARKGLNLLVDQGILYKKRGLGMFVSEDAYEKVSNHRQKEFFKIHIPQLLNETKRLGISKDQLIEEIKNTKGDDDNDSSRSY